MTHYRFASILLLLLAPPCRSAPELIGILRVSGSIYVALSNTDKPTVQWSKIGAPIAGYDAATFDSEREVLALMKDGKRIELRMKAGTVKSVIPSAASTVSDPVAPGQAKMTSQLQLRIDRTAAAVADMEERVKTDPKLALPLAEMRRQLRLQSANAEFFQKALEEQKKNDAQAQPPAP
ncbi:MAG: hypothetical protein U1F61_30635 [Opitutaceae bacterium]